MDLSFTPFDRDAELHQLPGDLATLLIGVAQRQAASPTAAAQARCSSATPPFQPSDGAFNGPMAAAVTRWEKDEAGVHHPASTDLQAGNILPAAVTEGAGAPKGLLT